MFDLGTKQIHNSSACKLTDQKVVSLLVGMVYFFLPLCPEHLPDSPSLPFTGSHFPGDPFNAEVRNETFPLLGAEHQQYGIEVVKL
jgi:hypothetical protein